MTSARHLTGNNLRLLMVVCISVFISASESQAQLKMKNDRPIENGQQVGSSESGVGKNSAKLKPDKKVTYKMIDDAELKLHCFLPKDHKASGRSSAIVFFFGGGWNGGNPKQFYEQSRALAQRGICLLYTSPSPRDKMQSRMPSSA